MAEGTVSYEIQVGGRREIRSSDESYDENQAEGLWQASETLTAPVPGRIGQPS